MKYYEKKADAEKMRNQVIEDPRVAGTAVQFEPYNGWVVVVIPKRIECSDLAEYCEVRDGCPRPVPDKVRPAPLEEAPAAGGSKPRGGGVTARVWAICAEHGGDRAQIMAACAAEGINKATAATQYSKWKRSQ